ncbi:MAG TPA: ornithine cyclodeaminase family protein [Ilumatobacteraceae bacterium]
MTLIIGAADVEAACDMGSLVDAIEAGLQEQARGSVVVPSRLNLAGLHGSFRVMPAVLNESGLMGFKAFHGSVKTGARYLVAVFEQESGELLALLDGHFLTAARTGATAGVAARHLARSDATSVAVIGSGLEARTNLAGIFAVRPITEVRVFSPRVERREAFANSVDQTYGVTTVRAETAEECVREADIVVVATNTSRAADPIAFRGEWITPGVHVSTIGSTSSRSREVDVATFAKADVMVVDSIAQATEESGDALAAKAEGCLPALVELDQIVSGTATGRTSGDQVTVFKSVGTALQDVIAGFTVFTAVAANGAGVDVGAFLDKKEI